MQPIQAHSIPYVWNPEKVDYSQFEPDSTKVGKDMTLTNELTSKQMEHFIEFVNHYFELNEIGLTTGKLELDYYKSPLAQNGEDYRISVDGYNPILKSGLSKFSSLEDQAVVTLKQLTPDQIRANTLHNYNFDPVKSKRLASALLLHEEYHVQAEKQRYGNTLKVEDGLAFLDRQTG